MRWFQTEGKSTVPVRVSLAGSSPQRSRQKEIARVGAARSVRRAVVHPGEAFFQACHLGIETREDHEAQHDLFPDRGRAAIGFGGFDHRVGGQPVVGGGLGEKGDIGLQVQGIGRCAHHHMLFAVQPVGRDMAGAAVETHPLYPDAADRNADRQVVPRFGEKAEGGEAVGQAVGKDRRQLAPDGIGVAVDLGADGAVFEMVVDIFEMRGGPGLCGQAPELQKEGGAQQGEEDDENQFLHMKTLGATTLSGIGLDTTRLSVPHSPVLIEKF